MDAELKIIRAIGRALPPIRGATAVINRVLKPFYLRRPRPTVIARALGFTLSLDPAEAIDGALLFYPHLFNRRELQWLRTHLKPDDVFVDGGAYIGVFSLVASDICRKVIAIEASPFVLPRLLANIDVNERAITPINAGLSDRRETLTLHIQDKGNLGGSSFVAQHGGRTVAVDCHPLHELAPKADILKLDVELMEYRVLASYFQRHKPRAIILEVSAGNNDTLDLCQQAGYRIEARTLENALLLLG
jgi:FkbM family methyltransferase